MAGLAAPLPRKKNTTSCGERWTGGKERETPRQHNIGAKQKNGKQSARISLAKSKGWGVTQE